MVWLDIIVKIAIPLFCAVITYFVVPMLKEKKLYDTVVIAVHAIEQIIKDTGAGQEKLELVKEWVRKKCNVSDEEMTLVIEAVVLEMNKSLKSGK